MDERQGSDAPRVRDLGRLTGPVLIWGGAVSNLRAAQAVLARAEAFGIGRVNRIFTGDAAGYCAEAGETLALVAREGGAAIAGNVEQALAGGAEDCGCGFGAGTACDLASGRWFAHARAECAQLAPKLRTWLAELPEWLVFRHAGRRWAVVHGGASAVNRFIWPTDAEEVLRSEIDLIEARIGPIHAVAAGHAGIPFLRAVGGRLWLNAGAAGLPPHDGRPEVSCALLLSDGTPRLMRVAYDHAAAAEAMRAAGLTQGYERTLLTGWWPAEDILPPALRRGAAS
ncbi:MAG: metallophosphoesterase [Alphaproteobacteria bacterium]|nr:MAG: metallophosphoesterase [Alphaproteobacteria bacterium]